PSLEDVSLAVNRPAGAAGPGVHGIRPSHDSQAVLHRGSDRGLPGLPPLTGSNPRPTIRFWPYGAAASTACYGPSARRLLALQRHCCTLTRVANRRSYYIDAETTLLPPRIRCERSLPARSVILRGTETLIDPVSSAFVGSGLSERRLDPCFSPSSTCSCAGWSPLWEALRMLGATMSRSSSFAISSQSSGARAARPAAAPRTRCVL